MDLKEVNTDIPNSHYSMKINNQFDYIYRLVMDFYH